MALRNSRKTTAAAWMILMALATTLARAEEPTSANPFQRFSQATKNFFARKPAAKPAPNHQKPAMPTRRSTVMNWFRKAPSKPPRTAHQFWSEERPNEEQTVRR